MTHRLMRTGCLCLAFLALQACSPEAVAPDPDAPIAGSYSLRRIEIAYLGQVLKDKTDAPVEISTEMARNWPQNYLPVLESQLSADASFAAMPKADCTVGKFDRHGREFTATGLCRIAGVATGTAFIFSGTNTEKAFDISVTMFPEQDGPTPEARRMTVTGTLTGT